MATMKVMMMMYRIVALERGDFRYFDSTFSGYLKG